MTMVRLDKPAQWPPEDIADCPADPVEAITYLRSKGFSKVQSMLVLAQRFGVPLSEAKPLVHFSEAWADRKASDEAFHDDIIDKLEQITGEE